MKFIKSVPNPSGAYPAAKSMPFPGCLPLTDSQAETLVAYNGFVTITREPDPEIEGSGTTAAAAWLGRNKKTIFLNLKKPSAVEAVKRLILEYDILVEQFRPGVMAKLGLDYETLRGVNPRLIYCSLTGYGQTGPLSPRAGHDINYMSRSGVMASAGRKATGPVLTNMQVADVAVGSMNSVVGILAAVHHRDVTGRGQYIDVAMLDGMDLVGLSWFDAGVRSFYTREKVTGLDDLQGLTIRVQESDMMSDMITALGAKPAQVVYSKVYAALHNAEIDGAENNWPSYEVMGHYEVAPFFLKDEHTRVPEVQLASPAVMEKLAALDESFPEVIRACARESAQKERELWARREADAEQNMRKLGICVTELDEAEKARFRAAVQPMYDEFSAQQELIDRIQKS